MFSVISSGEEWLAGRPQALPLPALQGSVGQGEAGQGKGPKADVSPRTWTSLTQGATPTLQANELRLREEKLPWSPADQSQDPW